MADARWEPCERCAGAGYDGHGDACGHCGGRRGRAVCGRCGTALLATRSGELHCRVCGGWAALERYAARQEGAQR